MIQIEINPIECKIDHQVANILRPILSYTAVFYQNGQYKKVRREYQKSTITKDSEGCYFFSGYLDKVKVYLQEKNLAVRQIGGFPKYIYSQPKLKGIDLREDQLQLIEKALKKGRGIIQAPTGSGKTIIGIALYSCFDDINLLWLCHTKDLMIQTAKEFKKFGFVSVGLIGDGKCETEKKITIATRQSFSKIAEHMGTQYDMVIVDETHHVSTFDGEYAKILKNVYAPLRFGLTATLPDKEESKMACEGLIGPVVASLSINEGNNLGIIAKPRIKFLKMPKNHAIGELRKYADVYNEGIVNNKTRNKAIITKAKEHILNGDSVLILLTQIEHGNNLLSIAKENELPIVFVQGNTENEVRSQVKTSLNEKKIKCVISTVIWNEGINIPELNVIINAAGGKSEIRTLQILGRGLRITDKKKELILWDIFDPSHKYLIEHFGERICIYSDNEWL